MNDLTITLKASHGGKEITQELDLSDYTATDTDGIRQELAEQFPTAYDQEEIDEIQLDVTDWNEIPKEYQDLKTVWEYVEAVEKHDKDIVDAAIYCSIELDDIDEAYQGEYKDDEDFAYQTADQLGYLDKSQSWPYSCIDWEHAANELMYDYSDHNGYYFRNL